MKRIFIPALFAMFLAAPAAYASHYDLADIDIVPAETVDTLAKNKVETTEQLLALLIKKSDRAAFAKQYNLDAANVELIAHKLELMQVVGIGPKAASLLILSDIGNLKALSQATPETLLDVLVRVNRENNITGVQPDLTVVRDWIQKAQKIANHIED